MKLQYGAYGTIEQGEDGKWPAYTGMGCYPIVYYDQEGNELCSTCADENDEFSAPLVGADYLEEAEHDIICDHCGTTIFEEESWCKLCCFTDYQHDPKCERYSG